MSGGFDPCECVWTHEAAMQRLLNMLRDSQNTCSDTECLQELPGADASLGGGFSTMMMMMLGWLVIATALFLFRPSSMRGRGDAKPSGGGGNGPSPPPPAPPVQ